MFDAVSTDEETRCAVLTGRGHVFCAGNDLRDFAVVDCRSTRRRRVAGRMAELGPTGP